MYQWWMVYVHISENMANTITACPLPCIVRVQGDGMFVVDL